MRHVLLLCIAAGLLSWPAGCDQRAVRTDSFRWGADQEGGGPFVYPRDDDPEQVTGFEVDLANALGRQMVLRAEFVQCTWDEILPLLDRGNIEVGLNGYEFTANRAERYLPSLPYYIYELGLCVRRDDERLTGWDSLRVAPANGRKWRIGVLEAAASDRYVSEKFAEHCEPIRYQGSAEALRLVETGQLDATVQDLPILQFYLNRLRRHPRLTIADRPVEPGYYVAYAAPRDGELIARLNTALRQLYDSGELQRIYEQYGIWNEAQSRLPEVWRDWHSELTPPAESKWVDLSRQAPLLVRAAGVTVMLCALSMPLAMAVGLTIALVRGWATPALGGGDHQPFWQCALRWLATLYVEIVRGTPLAFQLFVVYFILPEVGVRIHEFWAGVVALAVNYSAYEAEIFRLGLQAIPRGQIEAALSLGMPRSLAVRRIILPQAWRIVIPASANDFIALFKDTAVCSVIAVGELSKQYSMGAKSTGLFFEMAGLTSVLYLAMSYPLSLVSGWLERKLKH